MVIGSSFDSTALGAFSSVSTRKTSDTPTASTSTASASKPEDYLTTGDIKMIEYVSGTNSLADAELNPRAKALAEWIGTKREHGYVQGDISKNYWSSQLTASDAKLIEGMTGTTTIIDAIEKGDQGVYQLAQNIALDREDGSLKSDVSPSYLKNIQSAEEDEMAYAASMGQSPEKATPAVPIEALLRAISYLSSHITSGTNLATNA